MSTSNTIVNIDEANFDFYHNIKKRKEVAFRKGTVINNQDYVKITKKDFDEAGRQRSAGSVVTFTRNGKMGIIPKRKLESKKQWWQEIDTSNGGIVKTKSTDELLRMLKKRRDEVLYTKKFYLAGSNENFVISDKTSTTRLASYRIVTNNDNLETTWYNKEADASFIMGKNDIDDVYDRIVSHHAVTHTQYTVMKDALINEGRIKDFINWNALEEVASVH